MGSVRRTGGDRAFYQGEYGGLHCPFGTNAEPELAKSESPALWGICLAHHVSHELKNDKRVKGQLGNGL